MLKKQLSIISSFTLLTSSFGTVVSCGPDTSKLINLNTVDFSTIDNTIYIKGDMDGGKTASDQVVQENLINQLAFAANLNVQDSQVIKNFTKLDNYSVKGRAEDNTVADLAEISVSFSAKTSGFFLDNTKTKLVTFKARIGSGLIPINNLTLNQVHTKTPDLSWMWKSKDLENALLKTFVSDNKKYLKNANETDLELILKNSSNVVVDDWNINSLKNNDKLSCTFYAFGYANNSEKKKDILLGGEYDGKVGTQTSTITILVNSSLNN